MFMIQTMAIILPKLQREINEKIQKTLEVKPAKKIYNYFTRQWEYVTEGNSGKKE